MKTSEISTHLITENALPQAASKENSSKKSDLFLLAMVMVMNHLHEIVMNSWEKVSEANTQLAQDNASAHQARTIRHGQEEATRLQGERRHLQTHFGSLKA